MSMPLRFAVSENVPTTLPLAGHTHSTLSSSSPASFALARGAGDSAFAGGAGAAAAGAAGAAIATASGGDAGAEGARVASRNACSEYGSLNALGSFFSVSVLRAADATAGADAAGVEAAGAPGFDS